MLAKDRRMFSWTTGSPANCKGHTGPFPLPRDAGVCRAVSCEAKREKLQALRERATALCTIDSNQRK